MYGKTWHDSSSLICSSSIFCGSSVQEPKELVDEYISTDPPLETSTFSISASASVVVGAWDNTLTRASSAVDAISSNEDEIVLQGCTIISLPFVTPGWMIGEGVLLFSLSLTGWQLSLDNSSLLELMLEDPSLLTDHSEISDDWLAGDVRFVRSWSFSVFLAFSTLSLLHDDTRFFFLLQILGLLTEERSSLCTFFRDVPPRFNKAFENRLALVPWFSGVSLVTPCLPFEQAAKQLPMLKIFGERLCTYSSLHLTFFNWRCDKLQLFCNQTLDAEIRTNYTVCAHSQFISCLPEEKKQSWKIDDVEGDRKRRSNYRKSLCKI